MRFSSNHKFLASSKSMPCFNRFDRLLSLSYPNFMYLLYIFCINFRHILKIPPLILFFLEGDPVNPGLSFAQFCQPLLDGIYPHPHPNPHPQAGEGEMGGVEQSLGVTSGEALRGNDSHRPLGLVNRHSFETRRTRRRTLFLENREMFRSFQV
jgi:hypothetical protein